MKTHSRLFGSCVLVVAFLNGAIAHAVQPKTEKGAGTASRLLPAEIQFNHGKVCRIGMKFGFVAKLFEADGLQWGELTDCNVLVYGLTDKPSIADTALLKEWTKKPGSYLVLDGSGAGNGDPERLAGLGRSLFHAGMAADALVFNPGDSPDGGALTPLYTRPHLAQIVQTEKGADLSGNSAENFFGINLR